MLKSKLSADDGDSRAWRFSGEEQNVQQSLTEFLGALEKQLLRVHPTFVNVFRLRDQTLSVTALGNRLVMELLQHLCGREEGFLFFQRPAINISTGPLSAKPANLQICPPQAQNFNLKYDNIIKIAQFSQIFHNRDP